MRLYALNAKKTTPISFAKSHTPAQFSPDPPQAPLLTIPASPACRRLSPPVHFPDGHQKTGTRMDLTHISRRVPHKSPDPVLLCAGV